MEVVVNPPKPDEPSYDLFMKEKQKVLGELALKAKMTTETLNSIEGITCNEVMGAMYAFPQLKLPEKACEEAKVTTLDLLKSRAKKKESGRERHDLRTSDSKFTREA